MSAHVMKRDAWDRFAYDRARDATRAAAPGLSAVEGMSGGRAWWPSAVQDIHAALKLAPKLAAETDAPAEHRSLLADVTRMPEWETLRATVQGDEPARVLATVEMASKLAGTLAKARDEEERRKAARDAIRTAAKATGEAQEAADLIGAGPGAGAGDGPAQDSDPASLVKLAAALRSNANLRRILEQAGRMSRVAQYAKMARIKAGNGVIVGVETGNELARVLPTEYAMGEIMPDEFTRRYLERQLLQLETEADEPTGRGPIVACLDSSGSMSGDREVWSKAVALTLLSLAREEGRAFTLLSFSDGHQLRRWDWPTAPSLADIVAALAFSWHGGTAFRPCLDAALAACEASRFAKADIVFITDGDAGDLDAPWMADWSKRKAAKAVRLHTIYVECHSRTLDPISDACEWMGDTNEDDAALALAFGGVQ